MSCAWVGGFGSRRRRGCGLQTGMATVVVAVTVTVMVVMVMKTQPSNTAP